MRAHRSTRTGLLQATSYAVGPFEEPRTRLLLLLALHAVVWTCVYVSVRSNLDAPGDMVEAFAWGQGWQWGYWKHPPLMAWVSGAWFSLMPRSDLSYAVLACLNATVGLLGVQAMARELVDRRWVFPCVAAAALTPGLTVMAMRFNANAVLLSIWPWAIAWFARAMRTGHPRDAAVAGVMCALTLLGKYFSAALLAALVLAALAHRPWRARLLSSTGVVGVVACLLALTPHLHWLMVHAGGTLRYAAQATGYAIDSPVARALIFTVMMLVYPLLSLGLIAHVLPKETSGFVGRGGHWVRMARVMLQPSSRPVWMIAWMPILFVACATVFTAARTTALWGLAMSFAIILLAADGAAATGRRPDARRVWPWLGVVWLIALVMAPVIWDQAARRGVRGQTEPRAELTQALEAQWLQAYGSKLKWVTGTRPIAMSASFYSASGAQYWNAWARELDSPWVNEARVRQDGYAVVCDSRIEPDCPRQARQLCGTVQAITVAKRTRGYTFDPVRFDVAFCAPAQPEKRSR